MASTSSSMSSSTTPYDEETMSFGSLVDSVEDLQFQSDSDSMEEFVLEHLLELLSLDISDADDDDHADTASIIARSSMSDQEIFEWQWNIPAEPGRSPHAARAPVHLRAERRTERQVSAPPFIISWQIDDLRLVRCSVWSKLLDRSLCRVATDRCLVEAFRNGTLEPYPLY